jgi:glycosyltransferase involved in cell wall biosynthesis
MPKLLYVTPALNGPAVGGRASLSRLHQNCLRELLGNGLAIEELEQSTAPVGTFQALLGYINGVTPAAIRRIVQRISDEGIDRVYLDGSNLGRLAAAIHSQLPHVELFTFFHNVEARFFLGALKQRPGLRALAVMVANYLAERAAVRSSSRLVTLSQRDGRGLARLYGRGATDTLPMAVQDRLESLSAEAERVADGGYALFVGGAFYANQAGILWFAKNVAPQLPIRTVVIGNGMESLREELERNGAVEVIGGVESVAPWYVAARVVIAPIFDGSGMKTKVAEALMFGKRIVGTPEAFSGYDEIADAAGWVCASKDEFVSALHEVEQFSIPRFDPALRSLYEQRYSERAAVAGFQRLFEESSFSIGVA